MRLRFALVLGLVTACGGLRADPLDVDDSADAGGDAPQGDDDVGDDDDDDDTVVDAGGDHDAATPPCTIPAPDDPHNCGACGHDCLGGACAGSVCQPVTLANNCAALSDLAVAGSTVYFMESGPSQQQARIRFASAGCLDGPDCAKLFRAVPSGVYLAADTTHLYWAAGGLGTGMVSRVEFGGGEPEPFLEVEAVGQLALGRQTLFAIAQGTGNEDGQIVTLETEQLGPDPAEPFVFVDHLSSPYDVVFDDDELLITERGPVGTTGAGRVVGAPIGEADIHVLEDGQNSVRGLAATATQVFWVDAGRGTLSRVDRTGDDSVDLQSGLRRPFAVLVADDRVYWVERGNDPDYLDGRVQSCKLDGSGLVTLAENLPSPMQIDHDQDAIYFTTRGTADNFYGDGMVFKIAKP